MGLDKVSAFSAHRIGSTDANLLMYLRRSSELMDMSLARKQRQDMRLDFFCTENS